MDAPDPLPEFADRIRSVLPARALLVGGSLATGDHRPGISDLDLVAILPAPLPTADRPRLRRLHRSLIHANPAARKLHCAYLPATGLADPALPHPTWMVGRLVDRPLSVVARTELHRTGFAVFGDSPRWACPRWACPARWWRRSRGAGAAKTSGCPRRTASAGQGWPADWSRPGSTGSAAADAGTAAPAGAPGEIAQWSREIPSRTG